MTSETRKLKAARSREPPLEYSERTEIDPDTGTRVVIKTTRRGILGIESLHYDDVFVGLQKLSEKSTRENLESYCDWIRDNLERRGLPSDRQRVWIKFRDGDWEPRTEEHTNEMILKRGAQLQLWTCRLEALTEPFTAEQTAGKLLEALIHLLDQEDVDRHLWYFVIAMHAYSNHRLAGRVNNLVSQAVNSRKARSLGPEARQKHAAEVRRIIAEETQEYWSSHPLLKGDATNTAACIAQRVNDRLQSAARPQLSTKTIADHIRASQRG